MKPSSPMLSPPERLALISVCVALNLGIGAIVASFKLPFYLDSIGTILAVALGGIWVGIATGIASVLIGSLYTPTLWAYALTAVTIPTYTFFAIPRGYLQTIRGTLGWGVLLGLITAVVSAPVTTYLFGGVSLSGADAATAYFSALGNTLMQSVLLGGVATDPIDKLLTSVVAFLVLRRVPQYWKPQTANA